MESSGPTDGLLDDEGMGEEGESEEEEDEDSEEEMEDDEEKVSWFY